MGANQKSILVVAEVFPPRRGGSGRWLWELYRRLAGARVHVAAGRSPGDEVFDRSAELPIERLPLSFSSWSCWEVRSAAEYARALWRLLRLASHVQADELHCGKCLPEGLLAHWIKRLRGTPFRCYAHGEELTLAATSRQLRALTARVIDGAAMVIANSQFTKELLVTEWHASPAKVVVMHPGVDTSRFVPAAPNAAVRDRLGWSGRRVILTVGALQKRKGQDMLIRALPAIRQRCPDVLYAIVGEGWERAHLNQLVADHRVGDLVQFLDLPSDDALIECYQQCDVFALPNRQIGWDLEGFGIALIEAQACGKPVIAGMSGGTADALQPGVTGELIRCDGPEGLARAVSDLLSDPARARLFGERARQWAVEQFDWARLTSQAAGLFDAPVGGR